MARGRAGGSRGDGATAKEAVGLSGVSQRCAPNGRHTPRMRGIQYAAAVRIYR
jgi:hypothetical protein